MQNSSCLWIYSGNSKAVILDSLIAWIDFVGHEMYKDIWKTRVAYCIGTQYVDNSAKTSGVYSSIQKMLRMWYLLDITIGNKVRKTHDDNWHLLLEKLIWGRREATQKTLLWQMKDLMQQIRGYNYLSTWFVT